MLNDILATECDYQLLLWGVPQPDGTLLPETHSFQEYAIYIDSFYNTACASTATSVGDEEALDGLKIVAYLCIRCLEERGMTFDDVMSLTNTEPATDGSPLCVWLHSLRSIIVSLQSAVEYNDTAVIVDWLKRLTVQLIRCFNVYPPMAHVTTDVVNKRDGISRSK